MFKVPLASVGQREKSVLSGLRCLAAILPSNPGVVLCSSQRGWVLSFPIVQITG